MSILFFPFPRGLYVPTGFVSQTTAFGLILTAAHDIADQALSAVQALAMTRGPAFTIRLGLGWYWYAAAASACTESGLDQRPAAADPVAVAAIHKLVSAAGKPTLGGILARGQPRDKSWNIKESRATRGECQSACAASCHYLTGQATGGPTRPSPQYTLTCLLLPLLFPARRGGVAYLGKMRSGESRMARQPRAQNAYAPCASASG